MWKDFSLFITFYIHLCVCACAYTYVCVYVCVHIHTHAPAQVWRSDDNLGVGIVLSSHHVGSSYQTQAVSLAASNFTPWAILLALKDLLIIGTALKRPRRAAGRIQWESVIFKHEKDWVFLFYYHICKGPIWWKVQVHSESVVLQKMVTREVNRIHSCPYIPWVARNGRFVTCLF